MRAISYREGLNLNYLGLYLSIKYNKPASKICNVLNLIANQKKINWENTSNENKEEMLLEMIELKKEGFSYKQIGKIYNLSKYTVYDRLREYFGDNWENRPWKNN